MCILTFVIIIMYYSMTKNTILNTINLSIYSIDRFVILLEIWLRCLIILK